MKIYSFEKLNVWQKSRLLAIEVYKTTKSFPADERFGMTSQIRRCAVSIASNIDEGAGKHSHKDKARFQKVTCG